MPKLLLILGIALIFLGIGGFLIYSRLNPQTSLPNPLTSSSSHATGLHEVPATSDETVRLDQVEASLSGLESQVNQFLSLTGATSSATIENPNDINSTNLTTSVQNLTTNVNNLISRVSKIETPSNATIISPTVYIPLGPGNSSSSLDWQTVSLPEVEIDPAEFPGYKAMYLEIYLSVYQGNGQAFARLLNYTDGIAVTNSDVSTTSQDYVRVISSGFTIGSGKRTYRLQLKTLTGYSAQVEYARIKVTF